MFGKAALRAKYEDLLASGNAHPEAYQENLRALRQLILQEGLPPQTPEELAGVDTSCSLRGRVWKVLLGVQRVEAVRYCRLLRRGPSSQLGKIKDDLHRTFQHDESFHDTVSSAKLNRVLNALSHLWRAAPDKDKQHQKGGYVQGMNLIAGVLLYVMPEADAFEALQTIVSQHAPAYFRPDLLGVHHGIELLRVCLRILDPELYAHLARSNFHVQTLMHPVLSLGTATPPLDEVLHLWDYLLAFGLHISVIVAAVQIIMMRQELFCVTNPSNKFRILPKLEAAKVISLTNAFITQIPDDVWALLVQHTVDPGVDIPAQLHSEDKPRILTVRKTEKKQAC
eukprot:m51a1_g9020 hypothetical protein (339) ;mRNA; f:180811-182436